MNKHDFTRPECPEMTLEWIGTHSNGTKFYRCKSCGHAGPEGSFTGAFHISEILQTRGDSSQP
ncbi:MAG: hypothetical protein YK1309IOTA_1910009 [Marine Group I thaumarchaeote]|nr:MAG: hypothetical protein YK1309IOTA_1910009 [Marine Group I thaumarchaeote]